MILYGNPDPNLAKDSKEFDTPSGCARFEIGDLMPDYSTSHPMYQILQIVLEIDMDETIFLLLVTITLLNSKAIQIMRMQDHLKLKLFRYLKSKFPQSEAILQFRKMEEILHKLLNSKGFYTLLQK